MPTLSWNKMWHREVNQWDRDGKGEPYGNQWGDPEKAPPLAKIRDRWIRPFVSPKKVALEIGPGGGRWTQYLLDFERLFCVDLSPSMFHYMLDRFGPRANLSFCQTAGTDFPGVAFESIDFVFTFGTFVHLDPSLLDSYLRSLRAVVKLDADLVLQYADKHKPAGAANEGFSPTTGPILNYMLRATGFEVVDEDRTLLPHSNIVHARPA